MSIRLLQFLRQYSSLSRRDALKNIVDGSVTVNGQTMTDGRHIVRVTDAVMVHSTAIVPSKRLYYKFNKPLDVISTMSDPSGRRCLGDYIRGAGLSESLRPCGRLDRDSSGLMVFSNDGYFMDYLLHPKHRIEKQYRVQLSKPLTQIDKARIESGFFLDDGPVQMDIPDTHGCVCDVIIAYGRNRIIRRAFDFLGYPVTGLHRFFIDSIGLNGLARGKFEQFYPEMALKKSGVNDG